MIQKKIRAASHVFWAMAGWNSTSPLAVPGPQFYLQGCESRPPISAVVSVLALIYFIHTDNYWIRPLCNSFLKKYFFLINFGSVGSESQHVTLSCSAWPFSVAEVQQDSVVVAHGLNCPTVRAILVSHPGIEPTFPALEGGFLTPGLPGKSLCGLPWWLRG